ncbi:MAG: hypothetical protein MUO64_05930, partial [Anaerolineales bacterium]|nr:hypothetical protein [Anaerolineales bacterium]
DRKEKNIMADNFGVPPNEFETVETFSESGGGYAAPPSGGGNKSRTMTIVIVVLVVLVCCCCLGSVGAYLWYNGDSLMQQFGNLPTLFFVS